MVSQKCTVFIGSPCIRGLVGLQRNERKKTNHEQV